MGLIGPSDGCFSLGRAMGLRSVVLRLHLDRFRGLGVWGLGFRVTFAFLLGALHVIIANAGVWDYLFCGL